MRRALLGILAAVSLGFGPGDAQAKEPHPYFFCKSVRRGYAVAGSDVLYGFAPIWFGDGTGMVMAGYDVDLDQCSASLDPML